MRGDRRSATNVSYGRRKWASIRSGRIASSPGCVRQRRVLARGIRAAPRLGSKAAGPRSTRAKRPTDWSNAVRVAPVPGPDRVLPAARARPADRPAAASAQASWSGCRSPRHGVTSRASRREPAIAAARSAGARSGSRRAGRARCTSTAGASRPRPAGPPRGGRRRALRRCAWASRGWEASPSLATSTVTAAPVARPRAISPPAPSVSSSGWAATTSRRSSARAVEERRGPSSAGVHARSGCPARGGRSRSSAVGAAEDRGRARPGHARRGAGGRRAEVGDAPRVVLVEGERRRARARGPPAQRVVRRRRRRRLRTRSASTSPASRAPPASIQRGGFGQRRHGRRAGRRPRLRGGRAARRRRGLRPGAAAVVEAQRAAVPAGGHAQPAPGEARTSEVPVASTDRRRGHVGEVDRTAGQRPQAAGHPARRRVGPHAGAAQVDREQLPAAADVRGHQRVRRGACRASTTAWFR